MTRFHKRLVVCLLVIAALGGLSAWAYAVAGWLGWLLVILVCFIFVSRLALWLRAAKT